MARLFAISDLHVGHRPNREALEALGTYPDDWLIAAGDVGDTLDQVSWCLDALKARFAQVCWVPGNHELWSRAGEPGGEARYAQLVDLARSLGVHTPEDPWPLFEGEGGPVRIALCFLLYDYSFRPAHVAREDVLAWARDGGIVAMDERLLHHSPHPTRDAWCEARLAATEARLEAHAGEELVLVNHWPWRADLVRFPPRVARYRPWCGTRATEDWHRRHRVRVAVYGHLHMRATDWRDGVRFEEVALGYPRHWRQEKALDAYLRELLVERERPSHGGTIWHR